MGVQVEQISHAAKQLMDMSKEMVQLSDSISAIVEENTASTEQMAATAKQVSMSRECGRGCGTEQCCYGTGLCCRGGDQRPDAAGRGFKLCFEYNVRRFQATD